jgi:hypothetical protein
MIAHQVEQFDRSVLALIIPDNWLASPRVEKKQALSIQCASGGSLSRSYPNPSLAEIAMAQGQKSCTARDWRKSRRERAASKCYIITRDAQQPVRYGSEPGIDAATGRECRAVTPQVLGRLHEYENGNRPKLIRSEEPAFFDALTGEPIIWFHQSANGELQLFDLMGL